MLSDKSTMKHRGIWGYVLLALGFLFCPCHLIIVLPLLGAWLGGTTLAGVLNTNLGVITAISSVLFLGSVALGWWLLARNASCSVPEKQERNLTYEQE